VSDPLDLLPALRHYECGDMIRDFAGFVQR
jgi:hypothetical protein